MERWGEGWGERGRRAREEIENMKIERTAGVRVRQRERRGRRGVVRERPTEKRAREEIENMKIERTAGVRVRQR